MSNKALVLRLKGEINNPDAPFLIKYDPIESQKGSLFLWDAGIAPLASAPDVGASIQNILSEYAPATGNALELTKGTMSDASHISYIKREITSKGGLHFIVSQTYSGNDWGPLFNALSANAQLQEQLRSKLMGVNPNLFVSVWERTTRIGGGTSAHTMQYMSSVSSRGDHAFYKRVNETVAAVSSSSSSTSALLKEDTDSAVVGVPNKQVMNLKGVAGAGVLTGTKAHFSLNGWDVPNSSALAKNKSPSQIIYRIYVEDLSLSGRTYEQVKAIDDAEFAKAFAVGGRFHGDTWSNPATVLP